jgi:ketosteroid isomerase-like protein
MRGRASVLLVFLTFGGRATLAYPQASASSEEAVIRSLEERVTSGVLKRDTLALRDLWSEHFVVNAPANRVVPNRSAVFDLIQKGMIHYSSFEPTIEYIRVDRDLAIVMGTEIVQPTGKAPFAGQTVKRRFTHIWQKNDGWRLVARHANVPTRP